MASTAFWTSQCELLMLTAPHNRDLFRVQWSRFCVHRPRFSLYDTPYYHPTHASWRHIQISFIRALSDSYAISTTAIRQPSSRRRVLENSCRLAVPIGSSPCRTAHEGSIGGVWRSSSHRRPFYYDSKCPAPSRANPTTSEAIAADNVPSVTTMAISLQI